MTSFKGLKSYPNLRILDLKDCNFSIKSILVAFRSFYLREINGKKVTDSDIAESFKYSGIVTYALRNGFSPDLNEDPEKALEEAISFLAKGEQADMYEVEQDEDTIVKVRVTKEGDVYSWCILDDSFTWKNIDNNSPVIKTSRNTPLRCIVKGVRNWTVFIPEYDNEFHVFAEITGEAVEGGIIAVRAPLSSSITWRNLDTEEVIIEGSLVLPLSEKDVNSIICCDISPAPGLPITRLTTTKVKPGEFRFKSLRMQGQMIEDDDIEFEISTRGTKAVFKGVRILRSARHGEWENVTTIPASQDGKITYKLTVEDIGCVMRAVCLTEGGGPPLMLTSSERVQPSAPVYKDQTICGTGRVGFPLFAIAQYKGGIQGNCKYEWNIGPEGDRNRPVIVPTEDDLNKRPRCKMTPIRSDGSIGKTVIAEGQGPIKKADSGNTSLKERFLQFKKVTKNGRLQMSFVDECPQHLFTVPEGETLIVSTPVDWAVVSSNGIEQVENGQTFTATSDHIKGFVVLFSENFFVLVGQVEAARPTASNINVQYDQSSSVLSVQFDYSGGKQGRSVIQWNKLDRNHNETVIAFGRTYHVNISDRNSWFKALITPVSLDGKKGATVSSDPYRIKADDVVDEDEVPFELTGPEEVYEGDILVIATENEQIPKNSVRITCSVELTKRDRIFWEKGERLLAEGRAFTPTIEDIGTTVSIRVIDRVTDKLKTRIELPVVQALTPSIQGLQLTMEDGQPVEDRPTKRLNVSYHSYQGGLEGKTTIIWQAQAPNKNKGFIELKRTTRKWVEVDFVQFSKWKIQVTVIPTDSHGNTGEPVESNMVTIPEAPRPQVIDIKKAVITVDEEYKHFICDVITDENPGHLEYEWGYIVNGEEQYLEGQTSNTREILPEDFSYPLFCLVKPIGPDGDHGENAMVYLSMTANELFTPHINNVVIKSSSNQFITGSLLSADIDYEGPPIADTEFVWERLVQKEWIPVSKESSYRSNGNDIGKTIRVRVKVTTDVEIPVPEEEEEDHDDFPPDTTEFTSQPVSISANQKIVKLATALRRSKGTFDAKLSLGDFVSITIDTRFFIMKSKNTVLLKDQISNVSAKIDDDNENQIELSAHHGYNTQLLFDNMEMKGGTKLKSYMTRELFYETLNRFKA